MDSFVVVVYETPTTPEVQEAVVTALVGVGFTNPEHLVVTADSVIGELAGWLAGPAGGLLKRTFRCAGDVSEAKRAKAAAMTYSHSRATRCPKTEQFGCWIIAQPSWARGISRSSGKCPDGWKYCG